MYSSNQRLDITCDFKQFPATLDFVVRLSGDHECLTRQNQRVKLAFRTTDNGLYFLALGSMPANPTRPGSGIKCKEGWTDFPFDYDPEIVARIIQQWAEAQPEVECEDTDGSIERGIRIFHPNSLPAEDIRELLRNYNINLLHVLAIFKPFMLTYDK